MTELLYVTPRLPACELGGRALLSRLHWKCLEDILGAQATLHELNPPTIGIRHLAGALGGRIDGVTVEAEHALLERIAAEGVRAVFLNGSNLGRLARAIKQANPAVRVLTFCHNVERIFFRGALRRRPSLRALLVLAANAAAERLAVHFSDRVIALSRRDSAAFATLYGRGATDVLPMALEDTLARADHRNGGTAGEPYLLFVGGGFYANREGIRWFARHVAPVAALPTCVVGRGLDDLRNELERSGNLRLVGAVDDLSPWYGGAVAAIAPILDGSGMKTKVAEALMHGKPVLGTEEALSGYEATAAEGVIRCNNAGEFIDNIRELKGVRPSFHPKFRLLYDRHYSYEASRDRLATIVTQLLSLESGS